MIAVRSVAAGLLMLCGLPAVAAGQGGEAPATRVPRVGVVLSGGSAKGFAHVGVLEELEKAGVPIDVVAGTSMGSIIGGLYAAGYSPQMLRTATATEDWAGLFGGKAQRFELDPARKLLDGRYLLTAPYKDGALSIPTAIIGSQAIGAMLSRLVWAADTVSDLSRLPIPFVAVGTDLGTGEAVPLTQGPLSAAMRASMALPGIFVPVTYHGRRLIDGGVARNLPVRDARALGAEVVICVDVSGPLSDADSLTSASGILMQVVAYRMQASTKAERAGCDVHIDPVITGLSPSAFDRGADWIARGVDAAQHAMPAVRAMLAAKGVPLVDSASRRPRETFRSERLPISAIAVRGDGRELSLPVPRKILAARQPGLDAVDAERVARGVFTSGRYSQVTSRVQATDSGLALVLDVVPEQRDRIAVGLRYDSRFRASLLLGAFLYNRLTQGSLVSVEARLGEQLQLQARYQPSAERNGRLVSALTASYLRTPYDQFDQAQRVARTEVRLGTVSAFMGTRIRSNTLTGLMLAGEYNRTSSDISSVATGVVRQAYGTLMAVSWTDTYDRATYATQGMSLLTQVKVADRSAGSGATFVRMVADWEARRRLGRGLTLVSHVAAGSARGRDLPLNERFFLGGALPSAMLRGVEFAFPALETQARLGNVLQLAELGVQQHVTRSLFLSARGTIGNTFSAWPGVAGWDQYLKGASVTAGVLTRIGPASLTVGARRLGAWPRVALDVGHRF